MQRQQTSAVGFEGGPHDQDFKQQKLEPVCSPILTSDALRNVLLVIGVIFIILGSVLYSYSEGIVEEKYRYDDISGCEVGINDDDSVLPKACSKTFTIGKDMKLPVYFYYELDGFYQNHRKFLQSYSAYQLEDGQIHNTDNCDPVKKFDHGAGELAIYPCGLIANSFFSDRFTMKVNDQTLCSACAFDNTTNTGVKPLSGDWTTQWDTWQDDKYFQKSGIAWTVDKEDRFNYKEPDASVTRQGKLQLQQGLFLPKISDEDYMVWARTAALPKFRKLYRKIDNLPSGENKLKKGDEITVDILNWFVVDDYSGKKYFVLATVTWFGGKCTFLAISYLVIGCFSIVGALLLVVCKPTRKVGDFDEFVWKNRDN